MKILVINNHSKHIEELIHKLKKANTIDFEHITTKKYHNYNAIILSGGSSYSVQNHQKKYAKELNLIKKCQTPILGICLGFELINYAFGEELKELKKKEKGIVTIQQKTKNKLFKTLPTKFKVYEAHRWIVPKNKFLIPLAQSKDGIEAIKHPTKEIYDVQFHPEIFVNKGHSKKILNNFLKIVKSDK